MLCHRALVVVLTLAAIPFGSLHADEANFKRELDIIYHRQGGYALTMERLSPLERNGAAVVFVVSGGWFSNHDFTKPHDALRLPNNAQGPNITELLKRGYSVFFVVHGSQPKFTITEIHEQVSAAVRYIRRYAPKYHITPNRIGIVGGSAGGHLSLMQGTKGMDSESTPEGEAAESSRVQAVVAYFPPTDFVNYGREGVFFDVVVREVLDGRNPFLQALDLREYDTSEIRIRKITDPDRLSHHYQDISPIYHVTADDAPTLLLHGDADKLVPLQQSEIIAARFKEVGVPHRLFVKEGADHGWAQSNEEAKMIADWFDKHLAE